MYYPAEFLILEFLIFQEIIPLLILSICLNPELSARDKLLNLLFNLKKKPQAEERSVIVQSLIKIAQLKGSNTVENEILPQCWEQITNKYLERRMLAAESCFALAPYVSVSVSVMTIFYCLLYFII